MALYCPGGEGEVSSSQCDRRDPPAGNKGGEGGANLGGLGRTQLKKRGGQITIGQSVPFLLLLDSQGRRRRRRREIESSDSFLKKKT